MPPRLVALWLRLPIQQLRTEPELPPTKCTRASIHLAHLSGFENRFIVLLSWLWGILTRQRGARDRRPGYADFKIDDTHAHQGTVHPA